MAKNAVPTVSAKGEKKGSQKSLALSPPVAERRPVKRVVHGVELVDDYAWIRADNWQDVLRNPKVLPSDIRALIEAENEFADGVLSPLASLRKTLVKELRARIKEDDADVPEPDGKYSYYERYREGGEHELICRTLRAGGAEEILLDGDQQAKDKAFFEIGCAQASPDHQRLIWSADEAGSEYFSISVRDLATGQDIDAVVTDTDGEAVWTLDSSAFYYVRLDENHRPSHVFRHVIGTPMAQDQLIYEEHDASWFVDLHQSQSREHLLIHVHDHDATEVWLIDLRQEGPPRLIAPRTVGIRSIVAPHMDRLFIKTNAGGAQDFKLVEASIDAPEPEHWRDFVPHKLGCMIVSFTVVRDFLIRLERENGLPRIVVRNLATGEERMIAFSEEAYSLALLPGREFDTTTIRFTYSSLTTPKETYDYDLLTSERTLRKRQTIPSGHDPEKYMTRRVYASAPDGALVPISLLYARATPLDGTAPLFITGYGSYGSPYPASFSANTLSLVDRGFVFAIAHVRGGTDKGWGWYLDGKLARKPNTFADFIAATRYLIAEKFTSVGQVVASGGSAGGMLMGAIANQAPELFAGIVADVPFVDVINTMLDDTLPLTPPEWVEWGNPITDAEAFAVMHSYSPYDNVKAQAYPAILALSGLTDPRVTYWEPTKWVARLRAKMIGGGPVLLKTNMKAGHGGSAGRFDQLGDVALEYAFAIACVKRLLSVNA